MELKYWWLGLVVVGVLAIVAALRWRVVSSLPRTEPDALLAANLGRLRQSERFKALARRHSRWLVIQLLSLALMAAGTGLLVSRLMSVAVTTTDERGKDIVLCVDVSASASDAARSAMDVYLRLVDGLTNERVGLVIFNRTAATIFPLVSDYAYIKEQLVIAQRALLDGDVEFTAGTMAGPEEWGGSQIGDGVATCVNRFDQQDVERPRTLVLVTDNEPDGPPVYTFLEAMDLAIQREIMVFCLAPQIYEDLDAKPELVEMQQECRRSGGDLFAVKDSTSVDQIMDAISRQEAVAQRSQPRRIESDKPLAGVGLLSIGFLGLLLAGWRTRS